MCVCELAVASVRLCVRAFQEDVSFLTNFKIRVDDAFSCACVRQQIYQLFHLANHANMYGSEYIPFVDKMAKRVLSQEGFEQSRRSNMIF